MDSRITREFYDMPSGLLVDQFPLLTEVIRNFAELDPMTLQLFDARVRTFVRESKKRRTNR